MITLLVANSPTCFVVVFFYMRSPWRMVMHGRHSRASKIWGFRLNFVGGGGCAVCVRSDTPRDTVSVYMCVEREMLVYGSSLSTDSTTHYTDVAHFRVFRALGCGSLCHYI